MRPGRHAILTERTQFSLSKVPGHTRRRHPGYRYAQRSFSTSGRDDETRRHAIFTERTQFSLQCSPRVPATLGRCHPGAQLARCLSVRAQSPCRRSAAYSADQFDIARRVLSPRATCPRSPRAGPRLAVAVSAVSVIASVSPWRGTTRRRRRVRGMAFADLGDLLGPHEYARDLGGPVGAAHPAADAHVASARCGLAPGSAAVRSPIARTNPGMMRDQARSPPFRRPRRRRRDHQCRGARFPRTDSRLPLCRRAMRSRTRSGRDRRCRTPDRRRRHAT